MTNPAADSPHLSRDLRIDSICTEFEAAWKVGPPPDLEAWLQRVAAADRLALLQELVVIEMHYRQRRGEAVDPAEYRGRFPDLPETLVNDTVDFARESTGRAAMIPAGQIQYAGAYELTE